LSVALSNMIVDVDTNTPEFPIPKGSPHRAEDDRTANAYDDLAAFIRTINGVELSGSKENFNTEAFRESVDRLLNARAFLRWAAVNVLLRSWTTISRLRPTTTCTTGDDKGPSTTS
jgi:hypothetical protein